MPKLTAEDAAWARHLRSKYGIAAPFADGPDDDLEDEDDFLE